MEPKSVIPILSWEYYKYLRLRKRDRNLQYTTNLSSRKAR